MRQPRDIAGRLEAAFERGTVAGSQAQSAELARLRAENERLRASAAEVGLLTSDIDRLDTENERLRAALGKARAAAGDPSRCVESRLRRISTALDAALEALAAKPGEAPPDARHYAPGSVCTPERCHCEPGEGGGR